MPSFLLLFAVCCFSSFAFCFIVMSLICMSFRLFFAFYVLVSFLSMRYYVLLHFFWYLKDYLSLHTILVNGNIIIEELKCKDGIYLLILVVYTHFTLIILH